MSRKVFLHVGAPKTGTTYLQAVMSQNRRVLRGQGVRYADGKYVGDRVHASELARGVDHSGFERAEGSWRRILDQVHQWDGDAVISHEFFGACTESQARSVVADLAPAQVHVIFTARDYVRQFTAVWQERLKYGRGVALSDFTLDETNGTPVWSWRTQDAVAILRRWSAGLPPENVHVVTVPPSGGDVNLLWDRFASVIGVDPESCQREVEASNSSLGVVESELLRRIDERLPKKFRHRGRITAAYVRNVLANRILAGRSSDRLTLHGDRAAELIAASRQAATALATAGYTVAGDLEDIVPGPVRPGRAPEDVPDSELLRAAIDTIGELLSMMESRDRQHRESRSGPGGSAGRPRGLPVRGYRFARRMLNRVRRSRRSDRQM